MVGVVEFRAEGVEKRLTNVDLDLDDFIVSKAYNTFESCCGDVKIMDQLQDEQRIDEELAMEHYFFLSVVVGIHTTK